MSDSSSAEVRPARRGGAAETRARILSVATEMFYARGIRGTSADRILEQVGVTRVTFYRHFPTKTDVVVAYLEMQAEREKAAITAAIEGQTAADALLSIADMIATFSCSPGFRGCPFINAAAEFPDPEDPVRIVVQQHRQWTRDLFATLSGEAGAVDAETTAGHVMMLRDGAMVGGYLENPEDPSEELKRAFSAIVNVGSA
ncbi:TetR/AcrR family transcriptional regulator [Brachybacterium sp. GCM10030268]|uniref:TetR/AcrR family transcriptional regulator n=1 Tax=Brachybacterium sp. GCM10030268 TaxID=3273382 RepID=UPI003614249E